LQSSTQGYFSDDHCSVQASFRNAAEPVIFTLNSSNIVLFEVWNHVYQDDLSLYNEIATFGYPFTHLMPHVEAREERDTAFRHRKVRILYGEDGSNWC
jgi:hypothetical protein